MRKPKIRAASRLVLASLFMSIGCGGSGFEDPVPSSDSWMIVSEKIPEALLAIAGTDKNNVWAVGADLGRGPTVLHYDGAVWDRIETGHTGHLWSVHVFENGTIFVGGASGSILRWDGTSFTRMSTPGLGGDTVFGIWGRNENDVYAVGGAAGRNGFVWHYDGDTWTALSLPRDVPLTAEGSTPGLFEVWGDEQGATWIVGGSGAILRRDGGNAMLSVVSSGTTENLLTIAGSGDDLCVVGGDSTGRLLERNGDAFADRNSEEVPVLQGVDVRDTWAWASGSEGTLLERRDEGWARVEHGLQLSADSLQSVWIDPEGGVWIAGGDILSTQLDDGVILHLGSSVATYRAEEDPKPEPMPVVCPENAIDSPEGSSIARRWNDQILNAIRRDIPKPGVHARNLFHLSVAMWDAWATYDEVADGVITHEKETATDIDAAREEAISYASYRILVRRYSDSLANPAGARTSRACFQALMDRLGYDADDTVDQGSSPRAVGNRIGQTIIAEFMDDGANEAHGYADTTGHRSANMALVVDLPGTPISFPGEWQPLNLFGAATQNGIILPDGEQVYIGAQWGHVRPFSLEKSGVQMLEDLEIAPPSFASLETRSEAVEVLLREAQLEVDPTVTIDISPGAYGNNSLGTNDGHGHAINPVTGAPYEPVVVPRGDFGRVLAEFWADGPRSETPPGHWNTLANYVADHPAHERLLFGEGEAVDALEWDVKVYLALNGAVHDAAIVAWGLKREFLTSRPIAMIRHMAAQGQSSNASLPSYHEEGLPLMDGFIELITEESSAPGQRHAHLAPYVGQVAVRAWRGEPGDRIHRLGGIGWIRGVEWVPYQRRNFVTPAFPGFVSGHSTFSRSAAEVLTELTGDAYFPGGFGEFVAPRDEYLSFEDGPSVDVPLRWATYYDAADQAGQSRIWGGIHINADDVVGRRLGARAGFWSVNKARTYFDGTALP